MKSATLPSFWSAYARLDENVRCSARKTYRLWAENPFHPSLHFIMYDSTAKGHFLTQRRKAAKIFKTNIFLFCIFETKKLEILYQNFNFLCALASLR